MKQRTKLVFVLNLSRAGDRARDRDLDLRDLDWLTIDYVTCREY